MRLILAAVFALTGYFAGSLALAERVSVVRHIPGYRCMALNLSPEQMMDPSVEVPVYSQPSTASPKIGVAGATVAARDPLVSSKGFVQVLFPSGQTGWIAASALKSWRPAAGTHGTCVPAQLSNGRLGFDYTE